MIFIFKNYVLAHDNIALFYLKFFKFLKALILKVQFFPQNSVFSWKIIEFCFLTLAPGVR